MKKSVMIASVIVIVVGMVGFVPSAMALSVLEDGGEKVVYDDVNELYWYWDVYHWANQTSNQQKTNIATELAGGYFGVTGWHMANLSEQEIWIGYAYSDMLATFGLQHVSWFGSGITGGNFDVAQPSPDRVGIGYIDGYEARTWRGSGIDDPVPTRGAWVVAEVSDVVIPEPGTLILLGSGVLGLLALHRKYMRKD